MKAASRGVQFYHAVSIKYIEPVNNMTSDEIHATWYCAAEYKRMHKRERLLVHRLTSTEEEIHEEVFSSHGLESDESKFQRRIRVREGLLCVLMEQEQQWEDGQRRPERIAQISFALTRNSTRPVKKEPTTQNKAGVKPWPSEGRSQRTRYSSSHRQARRSFVAQTLESPLKAWYTRFYPQNNASGRHAKSAPLVGGLLLSILSLQQCKEDNAASLKLVLKIVCRFLLKVDMSIGSSVVVSHSGFSHGENI
jgi:hypothetical protein